MSTLTVTALKYQGYAVFRTVSLRRTFATVIKSRATRVSVMAVQLAFETTKRIRDIGTNRSRFVPYMNPLRHLDSTEGENY